MRQRAVHQGASARRTVEGGGDGSTRGERRLAELWRKGVLAGGTRGTGHGGRPGTRGRDTPALCERPPGVNALLNSGRLCAQSASRRQAGDVEISNQSSVIGCRWNSGGLGGSRPLRIGTTRGPMAPQAVAQYPFCVDEGFASLSAVVSYAGRAGEVLVELIGPTGAVESTATAVEAGDEAQQRLAVSAPAAGAWKLRVTSRRSAVLELSALVRADAAEQVLDQPHSEQGRDFLARVLKY